MCVQNNICVGKKYLQIRQIKFLQSSFHCFYLQNILEIRWQSIPQSGYNKFICAVKISALIRSLALQLDHVATFLYCVCVRGARHTIQAVKLQKIPRGVDSNHESYLKNIEYFLPYYLQKCCTTRTYNKFL